MTAVHLPVEIYARIAKSGKPVEQAEGVSLLSTDEGEAALFAEPGRYEVIGRVAQ